MNDILTEIENSKNDFDQLSRIISRKEIIETTEKYFINLFEQIDKRPLKPRIFLMSFMIIHQSDIIFSSDTDKEQNLIKSSNTLINSFNNLITKKEPKKTEILIFYHKQQNYLDNFIKWKEADEYNLIKSLATTWLEIYYKCKIIKEKEDKTETDKTWLEGFTNQMKHIEEKIHKTFNENAIDLFYGLIETEDNLA